MRKKIFFINGDPIDMKNSEKDLYTILKIFSKNEIIEDSLAVAVNNELVIKSVWKDIIIKEGDRIEIVRPFFGG